MLPRQPARVDGLQLSLGRRRLLGSVGGKRKGCVVAKGGWVYLMASGRNGTLYIGVTSDLARRVWQHRSGTGSEFVRKYRVTRLVHAERFEEIGAARVRERAMKAWKRAWKITLIETNNPGWRDLWQDIATSLVPDD